MSARSPGTRKRTFGIFFTFMSFSSVYLSTTSYQFEGFILQALKKGTCFFCYCSRIFMKKLTVATGRSPGTRKRTGSYLLNLYHFQSYICPKKAPFRVASLTDTHNKNIFVLFIFLAH